MQLNTAQVPCGHNYCRGCLQRLFITSMTEVFLFPPHCCGEAIPVDRGRTLLSSDLVQQYEARKVEYDSGNRMYCRNGRCSGLLTATDIRGESATCPECAAFTCMMCKSGFHTGDFSADTEIEQLLRATWGNCCQRYQSCEFLVELERGCNHMRYVYSIPCHDVANRLQLRLRRSFLLLPRQAMENLLTSIME